MESERTASFQDAVRLLLLRRSGGGDVVDLLEGVELLKGETLEESGDRLWDEVLLAGESFGDTVVREELGEVGNELGDLFRSEHADEDIAIHLERETLAEEFVSGRLSDDSSDHFEVSPSAEIVFENRQGVTISASGFDAEFSATTFDGVDGSGEHCGCDFSTEDFSLSFENSNLALFVEEFIDSAADVIDHGVDFAFGGGFGFGDSTERDERFSHNVSWVGLLG